MSNAMTAEQKHHIDSLTYEQMLRLVRYAESGHIYFISDTEICTYFSRRMSERKAEVGPGGAVAASKSVGWDGPEGPGR